MPAQVTVFVDDAVQGRFPQVSAATGERSDGWLTVDADVATGRSMPTLAFALLLVAGPFGWAVILAIGLAGSGRSERLTVRLPWSARVQEAVVALRRRRLAAWAVAAAGLVGLVAAVVAPTGAPAGRMTADVVAAALVAAVVVAVGVALAAEWRIGRETVRVGLDASRRWVTLGNVHPAFARAVRDEVAGRRQPQA